MVPWIEMHCKSLDPQSAWRNSNGHTFPVDFGNHPYSDPIQTHLVRFFLGFDVRDKHFYICSVLHSKTNLNAYGPHWFVHVDNSRPMGKTATLGSKRLSEGCPLICCNSKAPRLVVRVISRSQNSNSGSVELTCPLVCEAIGRESPLALFLVARKTKANQYRVLHKNCTKNSVFLKVFEVNPIFTEHSSGASIMKLKLWKPLILTPCHFPKLISWLFLGLVSYSILMHLQNIFAWLCDMIFLHQLVLSGI